MLMDLSSELIHSLLPLFMVTVLGASTFAVGIIEGIAEATAMITKVFSGYVSDRFRKRKPLVVLGYGLAALTKPMFPLAPSLGWIVTARFVDRVGKGIRGAPRDALIADITPAESRGAAFGLRQALDTVGAVAGPLLAIGAMLWFADNFRAAFWLAAIPAFAAVALLIVRRARARAGGRRQGRGTADRAGRHQATADALLVDRRHRRGDDAGAILGGVSRSARAERRNGDRPGCRWSWC